MEGEEGKQNEGEGEGEAPPAEEPPAEEPPAEEPLPEEPPPEEPAPPPEEAEPPPPPPPPEEPARASKAGSLQPVAEEEGAAPVEVTQSSHPSMKSTSALKQKSLASDKSLGAIAANAIGSLKSFTKSANDVEGTQPSGKDPSKVGTAEGCVGGGINIPGLGNFNCSAFLHKRSPFVHNPPQPEERRDRIANPRTPREYIINLREDLADFQESHGLPRTRDYTFLSLGLALAQETARALCSLFLMFAELFPIVAIVSLLMRFALDKTIEILETAETVPKVKKSIIFALQMLVIIIPLWIFISTIIIPLLSLVLSIFKRMFRFKGRGRRHGAKTKSCSGFDILSFFY